MFEFLQGRVVALGPGSAVLQSGGLGWSLQVSARCAARLAEGQRARLYVHLAVSDSALSLYGFGDESERSFFRRLLAVSGIGPASALSLLSAMPPQEIASVILDGDAERLRVAKGIGRKTAERLILELRDKIQADALAPAGAPGRGEELERILTELGFRPKEALRRAGAARRALGSGAGFQELLRAALNTEATTP
ncbi:MAG: Holliday junction branch migration protein RuvA [Planctomycetota bacterium]|nr:MAG: Holliday junction branch migration protein RuvA [Planctomycetota bacterium]